MIKEQKDGLEKQFYLQLSDKLRPKIELELIQKLKPEMEKVIIKEKEPLLINEIDSKIKKLRIKLILRQRKMN